MDETTSTPDKQIVCPTRRDSVLRLVIIGVVLLGFGIWCMIDLGKYPHKPFSEDINAWGKWATNFYGSFVCPILGAAMLIWAFLALRRKLVADEQGIGYAGKEKIPWSDVTGLDTSDLQDRQILYLQHGQGQKLKLDGYKLQDFKELLAFLESRVPGGDDRLASAGPSAEDEAENS
jgi:hypothetical protein